MHNVLFYKVNSFSESQTIIITAINHHKKKKLDRSDGHLQRFIGYSSYKSFEIRIVKGQGKNLKRNQRRNLHFLQLL